MSLKHGVDQKILTQSETISWMNEWLQILENVYHEQAKDEIIKSVCIFPENNQLVSTAVLTNRLRICFKLAQITTWHARSPTRHVFSRHNACIWAACSILSGEDSTHHPPRMICIASMHTSKTWYVASNNRRQTVMAVWLSTERDGRWEE